MGRSKKATATPTSTNVTTPATKGTQETDGTLVSSTWYSYYNKENDRDYFHEPVSGVVSWAAPSCGTVTSPLLASAKEAVGYSETSQDDPVTTDSTHTMPDHDVDALALQTIKPTPTFQRRLGYFGAALLATNVMLMLWARHSIVKSMTAAECEPCPPVPEALLCEAVPCEAVDCAPVACEPVPCQAVACEPVACAAVPCEPVACEPTTAVVEAECPPCQATTDGEDSSAACPPALPCEPIVAVERSATDCTPPEQVQDYLSQVLQKNAQTLEQVQQRVRQAAPQGYHHELATASDS